MPAPYFTKPFENNDHLAVEAACRTASDGLSKERLPIVLLSSEGYRKVQKTAPLYFCTPESGFYSRSQAPALLSFPSPGFTLVPKPQLGNALAEKPRLLAVYPL